MHARGPASDPRRAAAGANGVTGPAFKETVRDWTVRAAETRRGRETASYCSAAFFTTSSACCCISFSSSLVRVRTLSSCCLGRELGPVLERPGVISMPSVACRALSCAVVEDRATLTANANAARPSSSTMNPPSPFMPSGCHHHPLESKKISDPASPSGIFSGIQGPGASPPQSWEDPEDLEARLRGLNSLIFAMPTFVRVAYRGSAARAGCRLRAPMPRNSTKTDFPTLKELVGYMRKHRISHLEWNGAVIDLSPEALLPLVLLPSSPENRRKPARLWSPAPHRCIVDLTQPRPEDEPLLELVRIGNVTMLKMCSSSPPVVRDVDERPSSGVELNVRRPPARCIHRAHGRRGPAAEACARAAADGAQVRGETSTRRCRSASEASDPKRRRARAPAGAGAAAREAPYDAFLPPDRRLPHAGQPHRHGRARSARLPRQVRRGRRRRDLPRLAPVDGRRHHLHLCRHGLSSGVRAGARRKAGGVRHGNGAQDRHDGRGRRDGDADRARHRHRLERGAVRAARLCPRAPDRRLHHARRVVDGVYRPHLLGGRRQK